MYVHGWRVLLRRCERLHRQLEWPVGDRLPGLRMLHWNVQDRNDLVDSPNNHDGADDDHDNRTWQWNGYEFDHDNSYQRNISELDNQHEPAVGQMRHRAGMELSH